MPGRVSAVLHANDLARMLDFYCAVLGQACVYRDEYHAVLRCGDFALDIHQRWPQGVRAPGDRPAQHGAQPVKLSFPVDSIPRARQAAIERGGLLDPPPPRWVVDQQKICDGCDPEGNVFQLREDD